MKIEVPSVVRPEYFDIHSHVNDKRFDEDRDSVLRNTVRENVWTITVGTDKAMSQSACDSTLVSDGVFATIGVHPTDTPSEDFDESYYSELIEKYDKVVAIGECGLDYFRLEGDEKIQKERQKELFEQQIDFAVGRNLPLMIHTRDAHPDTLDMLHYKKKEYGERLWGNIHFFSGDLETAHKYYDLEFTTSITGVITFTDDYNEVVKKAPLDMIMSETDAPYVAPVPHRGKRNEPLFVKQAVDRIVELRDESEEEIKKALIDNAFRVFQLNKYKK